MTPDYDWDAHLERAVKNTLDTIVSGVCSRSDGVDILVMYAREYHRARLNVIKAELDKVQAAVEKGHEYG